MSAWLTGVRARSSRRSTARRGPVLRSPTSWIRPRRRSIPGLATGRRRTFSKLPRVARARNAIARCRGRRLGHGPPGGADYWLQVKSAGQT